MKPCDRMPELSLYHDGEMPGEGRAAFEAHLASCPACARELEELRSLSRRLGALERPKVSPALLGRFYRASGAMREGVVLRTAEWLGAAAAAILVAASAWLWQTDARAGARTAVPDAWELTAMGIRQDAAVSENHQLAQWMVAGLTAEDSND